MDDITSNMETCVDNYKKEFGKLPTIAILDPIPESVPVKSLQSPRDLQERNNIITPYGNIPLYKPNELSSHMQQTIKKHSSKMKIPLVLGTKRIFSCLNHELSAYELDCEPSTLAQCF